MDAPDDQDAPAGKPPGATPQPSWGNISDSHWSRSRQGMNQEALDYYRERSQAPGVAEGGAARNHYCMHCNGVIPLQYDQREPTSSAPEHCPHCGEELDGSVRAMFNWVEIDQPPAGDFKAMLPLLVGAGVLLVALVALAVWLF